MTRQTRNTRSARPRSHAPELLEPRRLFAAVAWTGLGDGTQWGDASNWSNNAVPTSSDDVTINVAGSPIILVRGGRSVNSLNNAEELWLQSDGNFGGADLSMAAASTNSGTMRLFSIAPGFTTSLSGAGTLSNSGTLRIDPGAGGTRSINTNLTNTGTIEVNADLGATGSFTFAQQSGAVTFTTSTNRFRWSGGTFNYTGGTITAATSTSGMAAVNAAVSVGASAGATTIVVEGASTLLGNADSGVTLWVQGNGQVGGSTFAVSGTATNAGTLRLESISSAFESSLTAIGAAVLANSGTIRTEVGSGGPRRIDVNLNNSGTITCNADLIQSASKTWNQLGGNVSASTGFVFRWNGGAVNYSGGTIGGNVSAASSTLSVAATAPTSTIVVEGTTILVNNLSPNVTVWAQGNGSIGSAQLQIDGAVSNVGTLLLQSIHSSFSSSIMGTGTLSSSGTIRSETGAGGPRSISVDLNNTGTITCNTDLNCPASGRTYNQQGGTVNTTNGYFRWSGGIVNYSGGTLGTRVYASSGTLYVASTAPASTIIAEGALKFLGNDSTSATVWAQGNGTLGNATITLDGTINNKGTLLLKSSDSTFSVALIEGGPVMSPFGLLSNTGTLRVELGSGGPRTLDVNLNNAGTIETSLSLLCNGTARTYNQTGGAVNTLGGSSFTWVSGTMNYSGGTLGNSVAVSSGKLNVTATAPTSTVLLIGASQLQANLSTHVTVWIQGNGSIGSSSATAALGTLTNNGTILLSSIDSTFSETFTVSGAFTNNGDVTSTDGAGGQRTFTFAAVDGTGAITLNAGAALTASHLRQGALTNLGTATIALNGGDSGASVIGALSLSGTGKLELNDNDLIVTGTSQSTIEGYVATAYNFGDWLGPRGIFSNSAKTNPQGNTMLGLLSGDDYFNNNGSPTFDGQTVHSNDAVVKYTYFGDVDFNGAIDASDYNLIDFGFVNHFTGWAFGDADYSGGVDASDYNVIDFAFSTQTGVL